MTQPDKKFFFFLTFLLVISIIFIFITNFNIYIAILGLVVTVLAFAVGGDAFVDEAIGFGTKLGLSRMQTGATILSFLSIVDEIFVVFNSSLRGYSSISFGAIQGSNLVAMGILLVFVLVSGVAVRRRFAIDTIIMIIAMSALLLFSFYYLSITLVLAFILILIFVFYLFHLIRENETVDSLQSDYNPLVFFTSAFLIFFASENVVTFSHYFYTLLGGNLFFWGFIIAGIAGSIPEGVMFLITIRKKENDSAIGLILSSSIYKATILLALATLISPVSFSGSRISVIIILVFSVLLLIPIILGHLLRKKLKQKYSS